MLTPEQDQTETPVDEPQEVQEDIVNVEEQKVLTEEDKLEQEREAGKWNNYGPSMKKVIEDEFYDMALIQPIREENVTEDGGIMKYVIEEGKGALIDNTDDVYYKHETRFTTGQLVDFNERRKVVDKFEMKNPNYHDFYKIALRTMRRGEIAWVKFSPVYHKGIYFSLPHFQKKTEEEKLAIGEDVYLKFTLTRVNKNTQCTDTTTFAGINEFADQVRVVCKECIEFKEYANAQTLYQRVLALFKNMSKKMRDGLNEEESKKRDNVLVTLYLNLSFCHQKRENFPEATKCAEEAIKIDSECAKGYFRKAQAERLKGEYDLAKESITTAIKLAPEDKSLREEHKMLMEIKSQKEKEWYSKMSGFYSGTALSKIETEEEEKKILSEKLYKQTFGDEQ